MSTFANRLNAAEASFAEMSIIVGSRTVASVLYLGVGAGIVTPRVVGRDLVLDSSIWRNGLSFIFAVAWIHSVWVVVMYVCMLGLVYHDFVARTVAPGVLGRDITLVASNLENWTLVSCGGGLDS